MKKEYIFIFIHVITNQDVIGSLCRSIFSSDVIFFCPIYNFYFKDSYLHF